MQPIRITERHSHLVFGVIQSALTCAVATGIASLPFLETGSFAAHFLRAWTIFLDLNASHSHSGRADYSGAGRPYGSQERARESGQLKLNRLGISPDGPTNARFPIAKRAVFGLNRGLDRGRPNARHFLQRQNRPR
jgi:hypothetical protein